MTMQWVIGSLRKRANDLRENKHESYLDITTGQSSSPENNLWEQDAKDLDAIAGLLEEGRVFEALDKCRALDTDVREALPEELWILVLVDDKSKEH